MAARVSVIHRTEKRAQKKLLGGWSHTFWKS